MTPTTSPADQAYSTFKELVDKSKLPHYQDPDMSESDTRAKLIDPLFKDVLGWQETEIQREEATADGFADYLFGAGFSYFHVEAKRTNPRFVIDAPSHARNLKLSGPHLLASKDIKPLLEQTVKYSFELGTDFAILSNGSQFILFKTRQTGRSWKTGSAFVWHSYQDILDHFAEFYGILSKDSVHSGSLIEAFERNDETTREYYPPIDYTWNPDREYIRNPLWPSISSVFGPLLSVQPDDVEVQREIVEHCYVTTPLSEQADKNLEFLLKDSMPTFLVDSKFTNLSLTTNEAERFARTLVDDITTFKPVTYILTGGVGSGKTTFLQRFDIVVSPYFIRKFCIWLHIDYLPVGKVDESRLAAELDSYTFAKIKEIFSHRYPTFIPTGGEEMRKLFATQIQEAAMTKLFGVEENSSKWNDTVNELVHNLYMSNEEYAMALLAKSKHEGRSVVFVLDNTDQYGEQFQEYVFLLAQKLSTKFGAISIVALREEKFFAAYRRGIFDAYGDKRFHIGSPNLNRVIGSRLKYGLKKLNAQMSSGSTSASQEDKDRISSIVKAFIRSTTQDNQNIVRMLSCVSNGDMRYALDMFKEFISSGNTNIDKILDILARYRGYTVPFHEFAKSAILGMRRFYRSELSKVVNLFSCSNAVGASHLTSCRTLHRLSFAQGSPSPHGEGFVETKQLLREYRQAYGVAEDFVLQASELLARGLIESEPPRLQDVHKSDALRISASGAYYWRYLVRSFAYIDLVLTDTPLLSKNLAQEIGGMLDSTDLTVRFERVRFFLEYIAGKENDEILSCSGQGGLFGDRLMPDVRDQIESEIEHIKSRTGAIDRRERVEEWEVEEELEPLEIEKSDEDQQESQAKGL